MATELNLKVARGETLNSGKIFTVVEPLPLGISQHDLLEGIANATYTLESLSNFTFTGEIRDRANATLRGTLIFHTENDQMWFTLPSTDTKTWPNECSVFKYDVFRSNTVTSEVTRVIYGNIEVIPAITNEDM